MLWYISLYYSCVSLIMSNYLMPLMQQKALLNLINLYPLRGKKKPCISSTGEWHTCSVKLVLFLHFFLFALLFPKYIFPSSQKDYHVLILLGFPPYDCLLIQSFQFWSPLKYPEKICDLKDMKEKISFSHPYEFLSLYRFKTPRT